MVRCRASDALQDLDRIARDAAAATVVQGTSEACLILIIGIYVDVLILLKTVEVIVLLAGANDAFFKQVGGVAAIRRAVGTLRVLILNLLTGAGLRSVFALLDLFSDLTKFLAYVALRFITVAVMAHETLHLDRICFIFI